MAVLVPETYSRSNLFAAPDDGTVDRLADLMRRIFRLVHEDGSGLFDGVASISQVAYLMQLAQSVGATRIVETGFNIGYSALAFLESSADARVVSFELQHDGCVRVAKRFLDDRYPGRHELVIGDSAQTVREYGSRAHGEDFDLVFVDGCHDYETVVADIRNASRLARPGATVVVDDLTPWYPWGIGPMAAWLDAVHRGVLEPLEYVCDGVPCKEIEGPADRAWAVGRLLPAT